MDKDFEAKLELAITELWEAIDDTYHAYAGSGDFKLAQAAKEKLKKLIEDKILEAKGGQPNGPKSDLPCE